MQYGSTNRPAGVRVEPLEARTLMAYADGVVANNDLDDMARVVAATNALGTDRVRMWNTTTFGVHRFPAATLRALATLHNAGKLVTMVFTPHEDTDRPVRDAAMLKDVSYASVKGYFQWLTGTRPGDYVHSSAIRACVDRFEIVNEVNLSKYYPSSGSLQATMNYYVGQTLRGAYEALHAAGQTVVGGSVQARTALAPLADARFTAGGRTRRYVDFCDLAGVHPYESSLAYAKGFVNDTLKAFGNKPITATEWNIDLAGPAEPSPAQLTELRNYMSTRFESAYFYRLHGLTDAAGDRAQGLLNPDYLPRRPYYDMFAGWSAPSASKTYVLASDDSLVYDATPNLNYGRSTVLNAKTVPGRAGFTRQSFLKFAIGRLKGRVKRAEIWLFGVASTAGAVGVALRPVASTAWFEKTLTWNNKPAFGAGELAHTTLKGRVAAWHKFDVSAYVRQRLAAGATSVSFALTASANPDAIAAFNSRDASAHKPTLAVNAGDG